MAAVPFNEVVTSVSQIATGALAAAIWQGILLAGAAAIGLHLLRGTPARVRFAIWFAVFALIAALPFASFLVHNNAAAGAGAPSHAWLTVDTRWSLWIAAFWAAASFIRAVSLAVAAHRVRSLWKRARPVPLTLPATGHAGRRLELCVSDEVDRPTVIGLFAPRIVLPEWLLSRLTPSELEQIVLHEAGHLNRRDDWLNLAQKLALVLFPLNPALAWIERRLCLERELACDERVLRATSAPIAYAQCLARIAEYRLERRGMVGSLALALGAVGRESELARRVLSLLSPQPGMKRGYARLVFGGAMLMLVFAAGAFEHSPQIVAFSSARPLEANSASVLPSSPGFQAVAVRAAVLPVQTWRTSGDAAPARQLSRRSRRARVLNHSAERRWAPDANAQATGYLSDVEVDQPRMQETLTTARQISPDADELVVTRWVTVSQKDGGASDAARNQPAQVQQVVHQFAAVPVQGGWLVFQL